MQTQACKKTTENDKTMRKEKVGYEWREGAKAAGDRIFPLRTLRLLRMNRNRYIPRFDTDRGDHPLKAASKTSKEVFSRNTYVGNRLAPTPEVENFKMIYFGHLSIVSVCGHTSTSSMKESPPKGSTERTKLQGVRCNRDYFLLQAYYVNVVMPCSPYCE